MQTVHKKNECNSFGVTFWTTKNIISSFCLHALSLLYISRRWLSGLPGAGEVTCHDNGNMRVRRKHVRAPPSHVGCVRVKSRLGQSALVAAKIALHKTSPSFVHTLVFQLLCWQNFQNLKCSPKDLLENWTPSGEMFGVKGLFENSRKRLRLHISTLLSCSIVSSWILAKNFPCQWKKRRNLN